MDAEGSFENAIVPVEVPAEVDAGLVWALPDGEVVVYALPMGYWVLRTVVAREFSKENQDGREGVVER